MTEDTRIPVFLITGFLGAGKSTLMRALARRLSGKDAAFLVSEFGGGGIDRDVIGGDDVIMPASGCICCQGYEEAIITLARLSQGSSNGQVPKQVFIETSGASDLAAILIELKSDLRFIRAFKLSCVVTLVNASTDVEKASAHAEWRSQIRHADLVVCTHIDEIAPRDLAERLSSAKRAAHRLAGETVTVLVAPAPPELLQIMRSTQRREGVQDGLDFTATDGPNGHGSLSFTSFPIVGAHELEDLLGLARAVVCINPAMLRMKLLATCVGTVDDFYLVQVVSGRLQRPERLAGLGARRDQGALYAIDSRVGEAEIKPLADLFLSAQPLAAERGAAPFAPYSQT